MAERAPAPVAPPGSVAPPAAVPRAAPCPHADRLEAARSYLARGRTPVPVPHLRKGPNFDDWQKLRPAEEQLAGLFRGDGNLGLLLGEPSSGLVDVDLDCPEALLLADVFLPATGMEHGRPSTPRSHRWYVVDEAPEKTERFEEGRGKTREVLVELRSTGGQTLVPPSVHPSGEVLRWDRDGEPTRVQAGPLREAVAEVGAASLLSRAWPEKGARHQAALALSGALLRAGWSEGRVRRFLAAVARAAGDPEEGDRVRAVADTVENLARGRNVTGRGRLKEILGARVVQSVWRWLRLRESSAADGATVPAEPLVPVVRSYSEVAPEETRWLWPGRIPYGMISLVDGDPGLGKSTITIDVAARVTRGLPMPDGTGGGEPGAVLLLSAEDDPSRTIRPRLDAAGADCVRVFEMRLRLPQEAAEEGRLPVVPLDLAEVERVVLERGVRLIVLDPLMAMLDGEVNSHNDQDVRRALAPLAALARRTGAAILVIRHLNKSAGGSALYRGGGSIGIAGAARSVLVVGVDPDDEGRRILAGVKCNLAPPASSLAFRVVGVGGNASRVEWLGASNLRADALVAPAPKEEQGPGREAKEFLLAVLGPGPAPAKAVMLQARQAGIALKTLRRVKGNLGVRSFKDRSLQAPWMWALPDEDEEGDLEGGHEHGHRPPHSESWPSSADSPLSLLRNPLPHNISLEDGHGEGGDGHLREGMATFEGGHPKGVMGDNVTTFAGDVGCQGVTTELPTKVAKVAMDGEGGHLRPLPPPEATPSGSTASPDMPPCPACASGHGVHFRCKPVSPRPTLPPGVHP